MSHELVSNRCSMVAGRSRDEKLEKGNSELCSFVPPEAPALPVVTSSIRSQQMSEQGCPSAPLYYWLYVRSKQPIILMGGDIYNIFLINSIKREKKPHIYNK